MRVSLGEVSLPASVPQYLPYDGGGTSRPQRLLEGEEEGGLDHLFRVSLETEVGQLRCRAGLPHPVCPPLAVGRTCDYQEESLL